MPPKPKKRTKVLKAAKAPAAKRAVRAKPKKKPFDPYALTAEDIREIKLARAEYARGEWIEGGVGMAELRRRSAEFLARLK